MNIIQNPAFSDLHSTVGKKEFCPKWFVKYAGPPSENRFTVSEEVIAENRTVVLDISSMKSWFRLNQFFDPVENSKHVRFSLKCQTDDSADKELTVRIMEVGQEGIQKTFINIMQSFIVPDVAVTREFTVATKEFDVRKQYELAIEIKEPMRITLCDVSLEFLDSDGKPMALVNMPIIGKSLDVEISSDGILKTRALTANPTIFPKNCSEVDGWNIENDYRAGLRIDQFYLHESLKEYGKTYTRFAFLEREPTIKPVRLRAKLELHGNRLIDTLSLAIFARADRLTTLKCILLEEEKVLSEFPLIVYGDWNYSSTAFHPFVKSVLDPARHHFLIIEIPHQGRGYLDFSMCYLAEKPDIAYFAQQSGAVANVEVGACATTDLKKYIRNGDFSKWSIGLVFDAVQPGQQLADNWFLEFRQSQAKNFRVVADISKRIWSADEIPENPKLSIRVKSDAFEGPLRICTPIDLDLLSSYEIALSIDLAVAGVGNVSLIRSVMIMARGVNREQIVYTFVRKQRIRDTIRLDFVISEMEMVALRRACSGSPALILTIEFEENCDVTVHNVQLHDAEKSRIIENRSNSVQQALQCEDPAIESQLSRVQGLSEWSSSEVVYADVAEPLPFTIRSTEDRRTGVMSYRAPNMYRPQKDYPSLDILVPIYNALESVKECVQSVIENTSVPYTLIFIDDASNGATSDYLDAVAASFPNVICLRNPENLGYTKSVNVGLRKTNAEFVCILNSDCIVTPDWLEHLVDCAKSSERIGMVGPLSNAASYQSIPRIYNEEGDWNFNPLPCSITPQIMAALVYENSASSYPSVRVINGFCQLIKVDVLKKVGILDEEAFPRGFGEENDFCARVIAAGYEIRVADDTYVYHTKSQSFGTKQRKELSALGSKALKAKHPELDWKSITREIETDPSLSVLRKKIQNIDC